MKRQIAGGVPPYFLIGAVVLITMMVGCGQGQNLGQSVNDIDAGDTASAFTKPFETLGTDNESAAFDDVDMVGQDEDALTLSKVIAGTEDGALRPIPVGEVVPVPVPIDPPRDLDCPNVETYFLRLRWGQILRDHKEIATDEREGEGRKWMNWSGSLAASSGKLTLVKTILFERNGGEAPPDMILDPTDRKVIAFDSYTKPHYDGLLVKYQHCIRPVEIINPLLTRDEIVPVPPILAETITFSARGLEPAPFAKTWTIAELKKIDMLYKDVDANHDAFQIQAMKRHDRCEEGKGTIHGILFRANDRVSHIKGRVVSAGGDPVGHIKGFFGAADDNGVHKVVAKFIGHEGRFKGILIGTAKDGTFSLDIFNKDRVKVGTVTGRYEEGSARRKGTFSAIYELVGCDVPVPPVVPPVVPVEPQVVVPQ